MKDYSAEKINWPARGAFVGASPVNALGYDAGWSQLKDASQESNETGEEQIPDGRPESPGEGCE